MTFIRRLFGREKQAVEPMRGGAVRNADTDHQVDRATRARMEAEVATDRQRRAATDGRLADSDA